ncbi:MAG: HAD family hydrolase [Actinomycetota bacterium]
MSYRLVLWDIDHTLIDAHHFHRALYREAFRKLTGRAPRHLLFMTGRTDRDSMTETLQLNGIEPTELRLSDLSQALVQAMELKKDYLRKCGRQTVGAELALRRLQDLPGIVQSALTGNLKPLAIAKLSTLGLDGYLDYDVGGYGEDHAERYQLVGIARGRAEAKYGTAFDGDNTVLIGDTLRDVQAGHLGGAPVVAVATGYVTAAELDAAGADRVLEDLSDTEAVLKAILETVRRTDQPQAS